MRGRTVRVVFMSHMDTVFGVQPVKKSVHVMHVFVVARLLFSIPNGVDIDWETAAQALQQF